MNIKTFLKRNRIAYSAYYYVASFLINFYKLFVRTDNHMILFVCYGGRHYSDSTRVIYEAMLKDERFKDYKIVWAFTNPEKFSYIPNRINIDSFKYIKTALEARCWITNVIVERALNFTGKKTYYFHTNHGVLVKLGGKLAKQSKNFKSIAKQHYDCTLAQSEFEKKVILESIDIEPEKVKIIGFPKNDVLVNHDEEYRETLRNKFGIPKGKKAILYAPTFREEDDFTERFDLNIDLWRDILGDEYVILYRAHPVVSTKMKEEDDFFIDVTDCEMVEDTMIASDILVSDYSGIIFDYCIMDKPIFLWPYDYETYNRIRGLYFDIRQELPYEMKEENLIKMIQNADLKKIVSGWVIPFRNKYATEFGDATPKALDIIYSNIQ